MLVVNKLRGRSSNVCAVKAPGLRRSPQGHAGRYRHPDRRSRSSAKTWASSWRMSTIEQLGSKPRPGVASKKRSCTIISREAGQEAEGCDQAKRVEHHPPPRWRQTESEYDKEKFSERLAKMTGGVAIVKRRRGDRGRDETDQGPHRRRAARHPGRGGPKEFVPGGGTLPCSEPSRVVDDAGQETRWRRTARCRGSWPARSTKPIRTIAENTGVDGAVVAFDVLTTRGDKNAERTATTPTRDDIRRHVQGRHRRPDTKVTRSALQNAASIAGLMLTTEVMITKIDDDDMKSRVSGSIA